MQNLKNIGIKCVFIKRACAITYADYTCGGIAIVVLLRTQISQGKISSKCREQTVQPGVSLLTAYEERLRLLEEALQF